MLFIEGVKEKAKRPCLNILKECCRVSGSGANSVTEYRTNEKLLYRMYYSIKK